MLALAWLSAAPALAALGQPASTIAQDGTAASTPQARAFAAQLQPQAATGTATANYTVQTVQAGSVTIAEYVNTASGLVFALRWQGPYMPDLRQILSTTHFDALRAALAQAPAHGVGGVLRMQLPDLVYTASGHMGHYVGMAYQPSLLPPGFDLSALSN